MATTTHERAGDERAFVGASPTPEGDGIDDAAPADAGPRSARAAHSLSGLAARWPKRSLNRSLKRRLVRGRQEDAPWVRPALLVALTMAALLYLWDLGDSGWANSFYAAAVQAGTKSWKAFFFGSFDSSNFITVDKPPASLWVMELSARLFGLNSWSILVPQALEGVAAAGVLYAAVRRWASPGAGLVAAGVMAVTPVAALMFRYNNPDALLVLLLCGAAYATTVATQKGSRSWLMVAFALVGIGFITKMLQAYLVVPAMTLSFLAAAPGRTAMRVRQLVAGGAALVVSSGWWVVAVMLVPARDRPYIGGSQDNSLWNLIFGYNGLGRLTGNESGSVGGGGAGTTGRWGATGLTRLFGSEMGSQISWLLPAALVLLVAALLVTSRRPRTDGNRAALVLWGGWLVATGLVFSLGQGIIHPYYNVALAPAIGAVVGVGGHILWGRRAAIWARLTMSGVVTLSAAWAVVLLDRDPTWNAWLRPAILASGCTAAIAVLAGPRMRASRHRHAISVVAASLAGVALLAGPAAYSVATAATPHSGAIPAAGPTGAGAGGTPGGGGGSPGGGGGFGPRRSGSAPTGNTAGPNAGPTPGGNSSTPGGGRGAPGRGLPPGAGGAGPGFAGGPAGVIPGGGGGGASSTGGGGSTPAGAGGGLLDASVPSAALTGALRAGASRYTWAAAVVEANEAAGYELASREPVMAIGGFNGTDPAPTLPEFEEYVKEGKIHYFITTGLAGPGGGTSVSGDDASLITAWVESNFTATTVRGVTLYDLSAAASDRR
jgi:4-amino-4-deoxy-L-arabinose transferase-like glycosyltransferase